MHISYRDSKYQYEQLEVNGGEKKYWVRKLASLLRWGFNKVLKLTRSYGPLRGPTYSSCGGLWPLAEAFFCPLAKKKAFYAVLAHFWRFLVSSSNRGNI